MTKTTIEGKRKKANTIRKSDIDTEKRGQHLVSLDVILAVSNKILSHCLRFILLMTGKQSGASERTVNSFALSPRNGIIFWLVIHHRRAENSQVFNSKNLCAPQGERQAREGKISSANIPAEFHFN